jgi:hypothetical protein
LSICRSDVVIYRLSPARVTWKEIDEMKQEFHLILGIDDVTDAIADTLFRAGFDDAHLTKCDGRPCIIVDDRDTTDFAATVRAAVNDAQRAGIPVMQVKIPDVEQINAELASALH